MAVENQTLPESFPAGTTVAYRRTFTDYPASAGWTLTLYLAGAQELSKEAVPTGNDFLVTLDARDTAEGFTAGLYRWVERVSNAAGEIYEVASGMVAISADIANASAGSEQEWTERAIIALKAHIAGRLSTGMESYQIAGRVVSKMPVKEALELLATLESRLARIMNPDFVTRPVHVYFTHTGFEQ